MNKQRFQQNDKAVRIYLRDIGRVPLLSREEEHDLAVKTRNGDEKARRQLINANLRLVVKIAGAYAKYDLPLLDLIAEGNIGLMKAVDRFDPDRGGKLSTYAAWWIRQRIRRALTDKSRTIRLPAFMLDRIRLFEKKSDELRRKLGREPTAGELAREVDLPVKKVVGWKDLISRPVSLDAPINSETAHTVAELIKDEDEKSPFQKADEHERAERIQRMIANLDPRSRKIITHRYGLNGAQKLTLEEVGAMLRITRERVRQIQRNALQELRTMLDEHDTPPADRPGHEPARVVSCS